MGEDEAMTMPPAPLWEPMEGAVRMVVGILVVVGSAAAVLAEEAEAESVALRIEVAMVEGTLTAVVPEYSESLDEMPWLLMSMTEKVSEPPPEQDH